MANLIIKPTSGGSLILQDEGGTAANTIDASGNTQLAGTLGVTGASTMTGNVTMSGTANNVGTVTAGTFNSTIGSSAALNHDAQKYAWHRGANASADINSNSALNFNLAIFLGSGVTESSGVITIGANGAGLYMVAYGISNNSTETGSNDWSLWINSTKISGTRVYYEYSSGDGGKPSYMGGCTSVVLPLAVSDTVKVYGNGHYWGATADSMTWFAGCRLGMTS